MDEVTEANWREQLEQALDPFREQLAGLKQLHQSLNKHQDQKPKPKPVYPEDDVIYFVRHGGDGMIKIGYSSDLKGRIDSIQTHCPEEIVLLAAVPGTQKDERALHKRFSYLRYRGEWFRPEYFLLKYIKSIGGPDLEE